MTGALQLQPPQIPFPPSIIQPEEESGFANRAEAVQFGEQRRPRELGGGGGEGNWQEGALFAGSV